VNPAWVAIRRTAVAAGGSPRFFLVATAEQELKRRCSVDESEKQNKEAASVNPDHTQRSSTEDKDGLKPALPELGTTLCPVCKRRVTVYVTKTKRPFINCGFCGARVFYNGSVAIRRLKRQMKKKKPMPASGHEPPKENTHD
jgi:hypothetical protein